MRAGAARIGDPLPMLYFAPRFPVVPPLAQTDRNARKPLRPQSPYRARGKEDRLCVRRGIAFGARVAELNPLGKVPVMVLDDGTRLFDSRVIVEYLDTVSPVGRLIPEPSRQRIAVKRWEALADGLCDAAVAVVVENRRPLRQQSRKWVDHQQQKITAAVQAFASDLGDDTWCSGDAYTLADIATGSALGYLDLRQPDFDWRASHPNLARLADKLAKRASFAETMPPVA
jgi:glutathione S-transferase